MNKTQIRINEETVTITGYVNAVERYSKPICEYLRGTKRKFVERIRAGAFKNALKNNDVLVLLNHNYDRELANTRDRTAILEEDSIGLRAEVTIKDAEVVQKAKNGELVGWSFGFRALKDEIGKENNLDARTVNELELIEVSLLDNTRNPAYYGTSVNARNIDNVEYREEVVEEITQSEQKQLLSEEELQYIANFIFDKIEEKKQLKEEEKMNMKQNIEKQQVAEKEQEQNRSISEFEERLKKLKGE